MGLNETSVDKPIHARERARGLIKLEPLALHHEETFRKACEATRDFDFSNGWTNGISFADYVRIRKHFAVGQNLPPGMVPSLFYVGIVQGEVVGRLSIRLRLNQFLLNIGGHIGYGVIPEHRRKGYATEMLRLGLEESRKQGLKRVLVTCDIDNIGSSKVIENNGGVLENLYNGPELRVPKKRYWIDL